MSYKIDIRKIVTDHNKTLINRFTGKPDGTDLISFFILPLVFAIVMVSFHVLISKDLIGTVVSALAIFVGLLLNVVVLLFDIVRKENIRKVKVALVREVLANIMYTILLTVACILAIITTLYDGNCIVQHVTNFFSYYLLGTFFTTLLMVIKRMYALFENEINESVSQ